MDTATRRLLKIGVLAGSFLVAACQTAKLTDLKPGERPNIQSTEAGLWLQADRMEQRVQRQGNLIRDPELHRYLHGIICRLSAEHCPQIRVYIVERAGFNASMTPNGMMIVQSGLMLRTQNEAQLAYVLGHEMAHYIRRHTLQRWQTVKESAGFMMIVGLALGASGFGSASPVVNAAVVGGIFANNRENEREADRLGLEMLAKAGYAPDQASKVWSNLIAEKDAMAENDSGRSFFATHPDEGERKEKLTQLAAALPPAKSKPTVNKKPFIKAIDRHKSRWLEKELRLGKFDRTTVLLDLLKKESGANGSLHYFQGELFRKRNDEGDVENAIKAYKLALTFDDAPAKTHRALGLIYRAQGNKPDAKSALADYLRLRPQAEDKAMIRHYLETMK